MITRPMKGDELEINNDDALNAIKFPLLGTPKLDGIRCVKLNNRALSSSFKDIPNKYVQKMMQQVPNGNDGELILKNKNGEA